MSKSNATYYSLAVQPSDKKPVQFTHYMTSLILQQTCLNDLIRTKAENKMFKDTASK